jgi:hypothetical protein
MLLPVGNALGVEEGKPLKMLIEKSSEGISLIATGIGMGTKLDNDFSWQKTSASHSSNSIQFNSLN